MNTALNFLVATVDRRVQAHVEVWQGLCAEAQALNWSSPIEELSVHDRPLDSQSCAGMLCWGWMKQVEEAKVPIINLSNARGPLTGCGNLLNDDREIGRSAARHLLKNGYREYLAIEKEGAIHFGQRSLGYREVLRAESAPFRQVAFPQPGPLSRQNGWNPQSYLDAVSELLVPLLKDLPPDAGIFAMDYPMAVQVENCLYTYFPERLHTTGLISGDLPVFQRWLPGSRRSISCVHTANAVRGRTAMRWFAEHGRNMDAFLQLNRSFAPEGILTQASTAGPACGHPVLARGIRWSWLRIQAGDPPTVEELAGELGMSSRTLNRLFHGELQQTTRDFLLNLRMERAAQMLHATPSMSIEKVAAQAGFTNQGAFSSAFRAWCGMSPRAYRAEHAPPSPSR